MDQELSSLPLLTVADLKEKVTEHATVKIQYRDSKRDFEKVAKSLGIMSDTKSGVPRTAYRGVVSIMYTGVRVHLVPDPPWTKYNPS